MQLNKYIVLSFGLDFDIKRADPGGEDSGEAFTCQGIEPMETGLSEAVEPPPLLDHSYAGLVHAPAQYTVSIPHTSLSLYPVSFRSKLDPVAEIKTKTKRAHAASTCTCEIHAVDVVDRLPSSRA